MDLDTKLSAARLRRGIPKCELRRRLREQAGLSQDDIADVLGCDRSTVSRYETGTREPSRRIAEHYARLLQSLTQEVAAVSAPVVLFNDEGPAATGPSVISVGGMGAAERDPD